MGYTMIADIRVEQSKSGQKKIAFICSETAYAHTIGQRNDSIRRQHDRHFQRRDNSVIRRKTGIILNF
jgi:uncharacterized ferredoxin-like protein